MTILAVAVSITAPALANFFRGRTLDSEARKLLSLSREGQSRAVSEGLPMDLWLDTAQGAYGLEAEPSYEPTDPKALSFTFDKDIKVEIVNLKAPGTGSSEPNTSPSTASIAPSPSNHPNLPRIRFLPDGSFGESSPQMLRLTGRDGISMWLAQARSHLHYEIRNRAN